MLSDLLIFLFQRYIIGSCQLDSVSNFNVITQEEYQEENEEDSHGPMAGCSVVVWYRVQFVTKSCN